MPSSSYAPEIGTSGICDRHPSASIVRPNTVLFCPQIIAIRDTSVVEPVDIKGTVLFVRLCPLAEVNLHL